MIDLDNNADAVPQLEAANVRVPSPSARLCTRAGVTAGGVVTADERRRE